MNQRAIVVMEIEENGHQFTFTMPLGAPIGSAYNAVFKALQGVADMAKDTASKIQPTMTAQELQENITNANAGSGE